MKRFFVGCCGWAVKGGKKAYFEKFPVIEIQETFYKLPRVETVAGWRRMAPEGFVFCMKAWQAVSHPVTSLTWRRAGIEPSQLRKMNYGWLRPVKENFDAWDKTAEVAKALGAKIVVVQTPPTMPDTEKTYENAVKFFEYATSFGFVVAWEPRGKTAGNRKSVEQLCEKTGVLPVVDVLKTEPICSHTLLYTRLHGLGEKEVNYSYRYTDRDLETLLTKLRELTAEEMYILFNNVSMAGDAARFTQLLKGENQLS